MKVVILCEGGPNLGMGHLYRMQRLFANQEVDSVFIQREYAAPANSHFGANWLRTHGYRVHEVARHHVMAAIVAEQPDAIVIDTYDWAGYDLTVLANLAAVTIFDDCAPIHESEQGGTTTVIEFVAKLPQQVQQQIHIIQAGFFAMTQPNLHSRLHQGPSYCLLANEYAAIPPQPRHSKLLVTFGSSDPNDLTERVANYLAQRAIPARILIGPAFAKDVSWYREQFAQTSLTFHEPAPQLYTLLAEVSHVLCSASTTVYEVLATHRQLATITTAANQQGVAHALKERELGHHFGWHETLTQADFDEQLTAFLKSAAPIFPPFHPQYAQTKTWQIIMRTRNLL